MDTKSKGRARYARPISLLLLAVVAVGYVSMFPYLKREAVAGSADFFEGTEFVDALYRGSYSLYWRLRHNENISERDRQRREGTPQSQMVETITVADVFFPGETAALREASRYDAGATERLEELSDQVYRIYMAYVEESFLRRYTGMEYMAFDNTAPAADRIVVGTVGSALAQYAGASPSAGTDTDNGQEAEALEQDYQYYVVLEYDSGGNVTVKALHGAREWSLRELNEWEPDWWSYLGGELYGFDSDSIRWQAVSPSNMTVVYGVPQRLENDGYGSIAFEQERYILNNLRHYRVEEYFYLALLLAACLGLGAGLIAAGPANLLHRIPLEIAAVMAIIPISMSANVSGSLYQASSGESLFRLGLDAMGEPVVFPPQGEPSIVVGYLLCFLMVLLFMGMEYAACYSVGQVRATGLRAYLVDHSIIVRLLARFGRMMGRFFRWITAVDLRDESDRMVIKIVLANFALITLFSCFWFFGIIGTVAYSVFLFYFLRRMVRDVKRQYQALLLATRQVAMGKLDVKVEEDLGVFDPLVQELQTIQTGLRKAVEEEVKSRSMKTELVANVSHDLKTPLTAIITYVGLLKDESITEEERREYVDTLDKKSQRLGRLIEDLFEMSKATTGNLTLNIAPVDLPSLVRQVELELEGEIQASGVEFRNRFSDERAGALLDGEKTYRVFENLMLNVTKYALAGTRAYVDVVSRGGKVIVKISNVSREPLDFDTEDITERFVRGDRSRGTEGSGLGLAIAKSLVELQGGNLSVSVDGDLFKVTVIFPASIA